VEASERKKERKKERLNEVKKERKTVETGVASQQLNQFTKPSDHLCDKKPKL
jgi:hypothetical protein